MCYHRMVLQNLNSQQHVRSRSETSWSVVLTCILSIMVYFFFLLHTYPASTYYFIQNNEIFIFSAIPNFVRTFLSVFLWHQVWELWHQVWEHTHRHERFSNVTVIYITRVAKNILLMWVDRVTSPTPCDIVHCVQFVNVSLSLCVV